jgi:hypothetical protein
MGMMTYSSRITDTYGVVGTFSVDTLTNKRNHTHFLPHTQSTCVARSSKPHVMLTLCMCSSAGACGTSL